MQLFNLQSTVGDIRIYQENALNRQLTEKCLITLGKVNFDKVKAIDLMVPLHNDDCKQEITYRDNLVRIISICLQTFNNLKHFGVDWSINCTDFPSTEDTIDIDSSDEISNKDKFENVLKPKIVNACQNCLKYNLKQKSHDGPWNVFCFRRHYQM